MKAASHLCALILGVALTAAAPARPAAFVNLPQLIAVHPLYALLQQYDREIAALRDTQDVPGLSNAAAQARAGAAALQRDASGAELQAARIASQSLQSDRQRERTAIVAATATQRGGDRNMSLYAGELVRATNANLTAYDRGIVQSDERAYVARAQQLREKELTLAFDLAKTDAGKRLLLALKLRTLHLTATARSRLQAQLSALDARESASVAALRAQDAGVLAAYRQRLQAEGVSEQAQMSGRLQAKAGANVALRQRIAAAQASSRATANLQSEAAAFGASYHPQSDAAFIRDGLSTTNGTISARFAQLSDVDRRAQQATAAQIAQLESNRRVLYRVMVAQIVRTAQLLAAQRHLGRLETSGSPPAGSVDLTGAVRSELAR